MSDGRVVYQDLQYAERAKCVLCLAFVPCTMFCGIPMFMYLHVKGPSGPPDAVRLSDDEARFYLDSLQGGLQTFSSGKRRGRGMAKLSQYPKILHYCKPLSN